MAAMGELKQAISDLHEAEALRLTEILLAGGHAANEILLQCQEGMIELGQRFEDGDCFIPELVLSAKIMEAISQTLEPHLTGRAKASSDAETIVMGTVENDIHSIGKDLVCMVLRGAGYRVIDMGINVPPQSFVKAIGTYRPKAVGMSVLLTTCYKSLEQTVKAIEGAGYRETTACMVGGAAASEMLRDKIGCDFFGKTPIEAVNFLKSLPVKQ